MKMRTVNHDEIRRWSQAHGARPALITRPETIGGPMGIRLDFPGIGDETLLGSTHSSEDTSWDYFFKIFEEQQLAFEYEDDARSSDPTLWYRFMKRRDNG